MVKCGSLWPSFWWSEWERQLPVMFALTFLHNASWFCHALFISSMMWEKELKRNRVLPVIMWVFPLTLICVGLGPLEHIFQIQTAMWMRKMSVGDSSSANETWFLTTQTQTRYLGDIGVWPCAFMGWGWNPGSRQMKVRLQHLLRVISLSSVSSFLLPLARILLSLFSWKGGKNGQNFQKEPQIQISLFYSHLGVPEIGHIENAEPLIVFASQTT